MVKHLITKKKKRERERERRGRYEREENREVGDFYLSNN